MLATKGAVTQPLFIALELSSFKQVQYVHFIAGSLQDQPSVWNNTAALLASSRNIHHMNSYYIIVLPQLRHDLSPVVSRFHPALPGA